MTKKDQKRERGRPALGKKTLGSTSIPEKLYERFQKHREETLLQQNAIITLALQAYFDKIDGKKAKT